ncbi:hypothetical protein [Sphingopyxis chilensis]
MRWIKPEMFGAVGDGLADDTASVQTAIDAAIAHRVTLRCEGRYRLSTVASLPDGHTGNYCLLVNGRLTIDGVQRAGEFVVPGNQHGICIYGPEAHDIAVTGMRFVKGSGGIGTTGHMIAVRGPCERLHFHNNYFRGCSDAAIGLATNLSALLVNPTMENGFRFGPKDVRITSNEIDGVHGDAALECATVTVLVCTDNIARNTRGHHIRIVGVRGGVIKNNRGENLGVSESLSSALVAAYSGGGQYGGVALIFHNQDIVIKNNTGRNCCDGIWLGIGSARLTVTGNDIGIRRHGIRIGHALAQAGQYGLVDSIVSRNTIRGGLHGAYIDVVSTAPVGGAPLLNVDFSQNMFLGYSIAGILESAQEGRVSSGVDATGNTYRPADSSVTSMAVGAQITYANDWDFRDSRTSLENGREIRVFAPSGKTHFAKLPRYKVTCAENTLYRVSGAHAPWRRGQRVMLDTDGVLPAPLTTNTSYWLSRVKSNSVRLASSEANARSGIGISLTDAGKGNHWIVPVE